MAFEIYLNFKNGEAQEAFETYEKLFAGKRNPNIMRYKNVPGMKVKPEEANYVLHAEMTLENMTINVSDVDQSTRYVKGTQVSIMYTCASVTDLEHKFEILSKGGQVNVKPEKTFFAESYTEFEDRFGIPWQLIYILR